MGQFGVSPIEARRWIGLLSAVLSALRQEDDRDPEAGQAVARCCAGGAGPVDRQTAAVVGDSSDGAPGGACRAPTSAGRRAISDEPGSACRGGRVVVELPAWTGPDHAGEL